MIKDSLDIDEETLAYEIEQELGALYDQPLNALSMDDKKDTNPTFLHTINDEMQILFPTEPCNEKACLDYVERMGGCMRICRAMFGMDSFDGECKFGCRRRSLISILSHWPTIGNRILKEGTPHKFMNCGCDCRWFDDQTPKRTFLAQYECWTCFGSHGQMQMPAEISEMKSYSVDELMELNKRRGVTVHYLGPKKYEFKGLH